jgi:protein TonB
MKIAWLGSMLFHVVLAGGLFWVAIDRPVVSESGPIGLVTVALIDGPFETRVASGPVLTAPTVASPHLKPAPAEAPQHDSAPILQARADAVAEPMPADQLSSEPAEAVSVSGAAASSVPDKGTVIDAVTPALMETAAAGSAKRPPAGGTDVGAAADPWPAYYAAVRNAVERVQRYPFSARLAGLEARVAVNFFIAADGAAGQIRLTEPSRFPVLNEAAVETIRRVARFPVPPLRENQSGVRITVPLEFTLHVNKERQPK